jgi:hypothetical protein
MNEWSFVSTPMRINYVTWNMATKFFSQKCTDWLWGSPSFLFSRYRVSFPAIKGPERGVNHPPPSNIEVKNECSYTSTPPVSSWREQRQLYPFIPLASSPKLRSELTQACLYGTSHVCWHRVIKHFTYTDKT